MGGVTNSNLKVSVIVPVYNVDPFLKKCIESIMAQTWDYLEVILVDDGSTDLSGNICDEMAQKDSRIKVIHQKNAGVSNARNAGIEASSGGFICFIDGDDYVMPDYIEYMLKLILLNNADIALTTAMFGNFDNYQTRHDKILVWNKEDAVEAILCYKVPIGCYCKLFRVELLKEVRFIPEIFIGEGFNFNIEAFQKAERIVVGRRKIYYYRRDNPTSAMTKFSVEKCECGLLALQEIKKILSFRQRELKRHGNMQIGEHILIFMICVFLLR